MALGTGLSVPFANACRFADILVLLLLERCGKLTKDETVRTNNIKSKNGRIFEGLISDIVVRNFKSGFK